MQAHCISPHEIRPLRLQQASRPGRPAHLSAASGLVLVGDLFYVVADDELHLGVFPLDGAAPGTLLRLFPGELPDAPRERKACKPDLEVLLRLPPFPHHPHGALLAMGSGSRANRRLGTLLALDAIDHVGAPRTIDLSALYAALESRCAALNIEGAVASGDRLLLFQRASKGQPGNTVFAFALAPVLDALSEGNTLPAQQLLGHRSHALGDIDGVGLSFTDATALPDGSVLFSAVAEDSEDSYEDGVVLGTAIGGLRGDGTLAFVQRLDTRLKIEGLHAGRDGGRLQVLMVTDADDPHVPAKLLALALDADVMRA